MSEFVPRRHRPSGIRNRLRLSSSGRLASHTTGSRGPRSIRSNPRTWRPSWAAHSTPTTVTRSATVFDTWIAGTRIKHRMGPVSLKVYDKQGFILPIETTVTDVSLFKHYPKVEHRDGTTETKWTSIEEGHLQFVACLSPLREVLCAANRRYLEFISAIDTPTAGIDALRKISASIHEGEQSYPGFNLLDAEDQVLMEALVRGEHCIRGLSNKALRQRFPHRSSAQISRTLKRLRIHGLIKKVGRTYHYYLTRFGRAVATAGLKVKELVLILQLAAALA
jgi:hypothetical protein